MSGHSSPLVSLRSSAHSFESGAPTSPTPSRSIRPPAKLGPGAEPYPPDGRWAKPDLGPGADARRHLYDHTDVVRESRA